jgi:predicted dehydrogenase
LNRIYFLDLADYPHKEKSMSRNIAVAGCGAIAQEYHLKAIANRRHEFDKVWVVDPNDRARQKACSIVQAEQCATLAEVADELQFVIVASPNKDHFSVAKEALCRGANVLIEKPFVIWPDEGRELIRLAAERHRVVAVNQTRRLFPYAQELRRRISEGEFGALKSIVHQEGTKLNWPFVSGVGFARDAQRTGVIMDFGVHVLDFYQYLLDPTWELVSAIHDGFNGPEGLAELHLKANNAPVSIRLSRYQEQENIAHLDFENARVQIDIWDLNVYSVTSRSGGRDRLHIVRLPRVDSTFLPNRILDNFVAATKGREKIMCDGTSSLPVIAILDDIYMHAKHYPETPGKV